MHKKQVIPFLLVAFVIGHAGVKAQYQENALRFSETFVNGTARFQGLGGGHTALGGDASALTSNPAGLGFYTRSELSISPGFSSVNSESRLTSNGVNESKDGLFIGNASLVIANKKDGYQQSKWRGTAMGVSFNRQQNFSRSYGFSGNSTNRRFIDNIVTSANTFSDEELDQGYYEDTRTGEIYLDYLEGVYYNLYAIDPENDQPNAAFVPAERTSPVVPTGHRDFSGSHSQWTFAYAGNYDNKLYIGGSLGFNRISNNVNQLLNERYVSGEVFRSTSYQQWEEMSGNGFNLNLGAIYKVSPEVQLGVNLITPTFMRIRRSLYERVSVELVQPDNLPTVGRTNPWDFDYSQVGPFRASLGGTYFLPGQLGFVTASADFVAYKGMSIRHSRERDGDWNNLDGWYRNVINPKVGVEFRLLDFRVRGGVSYFMDPYEAKLIDLVEDKISFSGGVGYRGKRFFADVGVVYGNQRSAYQLFSGSDTGRVTYQQVTGVLTLGVNF
jgi:hypothetical protein